MNEERLDTLERMILKSKNAHTIADDRVLDLIQALREERAKVEWIRVDNFMPDLDGHYFVYNNVGREISYFFKRNGRFIDNNITHWMPLPKPPKNI